MADEENRNCSAIKNFLKTITIEPVLFLATLAWALQAHTIQTLSLYRVCHVTLNYTRDVCTSLKNKTIEKEVQEVEMNLSLYRGYIETIPSLVMALILGAWSDTHGRKMPMLVSKIGFMLATGSLLVVSLFDDWPPETLFVSAAIAGMTGADRSFSAAASSYIADVASEEWRTSRFGFMNLARFISFPLGSALAGYAQIHWETWIIFTIALIVRVIAFIYLVFRVKAVIPSRTGREMEVNTGVSFKRRLKEICNWRNVGEYFKVLFRPRRGHYRLWLLLVITANWFQSIPGEGEGYVALKFFRLRFSWQQDMYGYYSGVGTFLVCIGLAIFLPLLSNKFHFSDPAIELIGNISTIVNPLIIAFSTHSWIPWAALSLTTFYSFVFPAMRSFASKLTDPVEYGKLFTIKVVSEGLITLFAGTIYTELYENTLKTFSGAIFLLTAAFCSISAIIFCVILVDVKRNSQYTMIDESSESSSPDAIST